MKCFPFLMFLSLPWAKEISSDSCFCVIFTTSVLSTPAQPELLRPAQIGLRGGQKLMSSQATLTRDMKHISSHSHISCCILGWVLLRWAWFLKEVQRRLCGAALMSFLFFLGGHGMYSKDPSSATLPSLGLACCNRSALAKAPALLSPCLPGS